MGAVFSTLQDSTISKFFKLWMKSRNFRVAMAMIILLFARRIYNKFHRIYYNLPLNGPLGLPLIGCKHYLLLNTDKFMARMSKYGDIATYNNGFKTILLINDSEIAKKLFNSQKQTKQLNNRFITKCIEKYIDKTVQRKQLKLIIFDIMMMAYFGITLDGTSINDEFYNKWNEKKKDDELKIMANDLLVIMANTMDTTSASLEWGIMSLCGKHRVLQNKIYREIYKSCNGDINNIDLENIEYLQNIPILKSFIYDNLNFSELELKRKGLLPRFRRNTSTKPIKIELSNGKTYDIAPNGLYQLNMDGMHKRLILIILSLLIFKYSLQFKDDTKYDVIIDKREERVQYEQEIGVTESGWHKMGENDHDHNELNDGFEYKMDEIMEKQTGSRYIAQTQAIPDIVDMEEEENKIKSIEPLKIANKINVNISHQKQLFHHQFNEFFIFFLTVSILFIPILFCLILLNDDEPKKEEVIYKKVEKIEVDKKERIKHEFHAEFNTFFVFCLCFFVFSVVIWRSFLFCLYYGILIVSWHILVILQFVSFNYLFLDSILILFIPVLFYLMLLNDDDLKKEEKKKEDVIYDKKECIKQEFHVQFNQFFVFLPCFLMPFLFIFIYAIPILFCFLSFYLLIIAVKLNMNKNVFNEKKEKQNDKKEYIKPKDDAQLIGFFVFCLFVSILFMVILHSFLFFMSYVVYYAIFFVSWHIFMIFQIFFCFKYSFSQFFANILMVFAHCFVFCVCIFSGFFSGDISI